MVGHTAVEPAVVKAVETVDYCVGKLIDWVETNGAVAIITADHGNAEKVIDEAGNPFTAHTSNPVPFCITEKGLKLRKDGNWSVQCGANYSADYKNVGDILSGRNSAASPNFIIYNVVGTPYTIYFDIENYEVIVEGLLPDEPYVPPVVIDTWGVIGDLDIGLWSAEVDMVLEGDNYVARDVIFANAEGYGCCFKIRKNDSWSENYGGFGSAYYLGDEIPLDSGGDNILIVDAIVGEPYTITFNPTNRTIIVN
jgi:hypothetical protein